MFYHAISRFSSTSNLVFINKSENDIFSKVLFPFINGEVTKSSYSHDDTRVRLINMSASISLSIYKTEGKLSESPFKESKGVIRVKGEFEKHDCTSEIISVVEDRRVAPPMRPLMHRALGPLDSQVFVIMKFGDDELNSAYDGVIKPLSNEFGMSVVRVDEIQDSGKIDDQILENIAKSRLIISDLTGERPNCYYETGFAHALGKDIVFTVRKGSEVHFDLKGYRFIQWKTEQDLRISLKKRLISIFGKEL